MLAPNAVTQDYSSHSRLVTTDQTCMSFDAGKIVFDPAKAPSLEYLDRLVEYWSYKLLHEKDMKALCKVWAYGKLHLFFSKSNVIGDIVL